MNKKYFTGTVPVNKKYLRGTVPVNEKYLTGTLFILYTDKFDPRFAFLGKKNDRSRCLFFSSGCITLTRVIVNDVVA